MTGDETLRDFSEQCGLDVGAFDVWAEYLTDPQYRQTLSEEFTTITPGIAMKMGQCRPAPDTYDFENADQIVEFGLDNGMDVRGHVLVWHEELPPWFDPDDYTDAEVHDLLREHVETMVSRYEGKLSAWDVVNEAVDDDGSLRRTPWYDALGEEYLDLAFEWAREADPAADLYYNDYGAEAAGEKAEAVYELVSGLVDRDVPIDGVGLQLHALDEWPDPDDLARNVERFRELGLDVQITEMDVAFPRGEAPDDPLAAQADYYREVVEVCLDTGVDALLTCGVHDATSWIRHYEDFAERFTDAPLLFDDELRPKPAYHEVRRALRERL